MKKLIVGLMAVLILAGCGRIKTGEVGVRTNFNKSVDTVEVQPGFYLSVFNSVKPNVVKETEISLNDMKPKAKDNLLLDDLDVSVFYKVNPTQVAELEIKYAGMTASNDDGDHYPSFNLIERFAKGAIFDIVGNKYDSLTIHNKRTELEIDIAKRIQEDLDKDDKGSFEITKVIVRKVNTDSSLEESIRASVRVQKETEQKLQQVQLAKAEAARLLVEASGEAAANRLIADSITPALIELRRIEAMKSFAGAGTHTVVMPSDSKSMVTLGK